MAIHHTLTNYHIQLITTTYGDEPTHLFTYYVKVLYLLNTHHAQKPPIQTNARMSGSNAKIPDTNHHTQS